MTRSLRWRRSSGPEGSPARPAPRRNAPRRNRKGFPYAAAGNGPVHSTGHPAGPALRAGYDTPVDAGLQARLEEIDAGLRRKFGMTTEQTASALT